MSRAQHTSVAGGAVAFTGDLDQSLRHALATWLTAACASSCRISVVGDAAGDQASAEPKSRTAAEVASPTGEDATATGASRERSEARR